MERSTDSPINNAFYDTLGERWYEAEDDPVALLRAEGRLKNPWVLERLQTVFQNKALRVLDIGCGAGFLANSLGHAGLEVVGVDLSEESLNVARRHDATGKVEYRRADALNLPFDPAQFDAVFAMDFLEHVPTPERVVAEAGRVLKAGGLFFFHTFNRNFLSWLFAVQGLRWFVRNTPEHLHVHSLFIRPEELKDSLEESQLALREITGLRPRFSKAFWKLLATRRVPKDFEFIFTPSLKIGYMGWAEKRS